MIEQHAHMGEVAELGAMLGSGEPVRWRAEWKVAKYEGDWTGEEIDAGLAGDPFEVLEREGNLLLIGGASLLWEFLVGNGVNTTGNALCFFNNANAQIGVGDSSTAAADTQTDLQAASNKTYKAMDATYPQHTDSTSVVGAKSITLRATFGTADANYAWNEWVVKNGTGGSSRCLNRKAESLGTKTSAASWVFTVTLSLA